jgi:hypothetical protein
MRQEGKGERYHLSPESWWGYRKAVEEEGRGYSDLRNLNNGSCSIHTRRMSSGICKFICTLTVLTVRTMMGLELEPIGPCTPGGMLLGAVHSTRN